MKSLLATLVGVTLMASVPAQAATDYFLNIDSVKGGESNVKGYEGQIAVSSWYWGLSNSGTALGGSGKVSLQDLSWTQYMDGSAISLFGFLTDPTQQLGTATLSAVRAGAGGYNFFQAVFKNNLMTSMSTGGSGSEDRPSVNFTMSMAEVTLRYRATVAATWIEASFILPPQPGASVVFSGDPMALEGWRLAMSPTLAVPEPASWALMLGGLLLTGAALRRRLPR